MAKSRNRRRRDTNDIANRRLTVFDSLSNLVRRVEQRSPSLRIYEDRRFWHPEGDYAPVGVFRQRSARRLIEAAPTRRRTDGTTGVGKSFRGFRPPVIRAFAKPDEVLVCVRRSTRREVLHALGRTGRGSGAKKMPRLTWRSKISCRRRK